MHDDESYNFLNIHIDSQTLFVLAITLLVGLSILLVIIFYMCFKKVCYRTVPRSLSHDGLAQPSTAATEPANNTLIPQPIEVANKVIKTPQVPQTENTIVAFKSVASRASNVNSDRRKPLVSRVRRAKKRTLPGQSQSRRAISASGSQQPDKNQKREIILFKANSFTD